jgi:hypothetical protein
MSVTLPTKGVGTYLPRYIDKVGTMARTPCDETFPSMGSDSPVGLYPLELFSDWQKLESLTGRP